MERVSRLVIQREIKKAFSYLCIILLIGIVLLPLIYLIDHSLKGQQLINTILYKIDHKRIENLKFFHFSGKVSTKYSSQILSITNKGLRIIYETRKKRKKLNLLMNKRKKFKEKIKRMMKYNKKVLLD